MRAGVDLDVAPAWIVVLIVGREFAVSGLRSIAASEGYTIEASDLGKTKMITQVVAITLMMLSIHWTQLAELATICIYGAMIFSLISAVDYFWKFWRKVDNKIKLRRRRELLISERRRNRGATRKDLPQPSD